MPTAERVKQVVKAKYGEIARKSSATKNDSGCSCGCADSDFTDLSEDYSALAGYDADADLRLGCGLPTELANFKEGDTVLDLGSGAGNDVFVARAMVGESGKVIGVDMTPEMHVKANENLAKLGYRNVEFRLGEIENLPVSAGEIDVVISNCVLNLVPDKEKAFSEIYRTLKPGGHFCISDIVTVGKLPARLRENAELYAGCVAGALPKEEYLNIIRKAGFSDVAVKQEKRIELDDTILSKYLTTDEIQEYGTSETGLYSVTVYGTKPTSPKSSF
ncbi:MAG: arsenite methyltransferase [bacterium]